MKILNLLNPFFYLGMLIWFIGESTERGMEVAYKIVENRKAKKRIKQLVKEMQR